mgnify:CR=1 FL=1
MDIIKYIPVTAAKEQWKPMMCDVIKVTMRYNITHTAVCFELFDKLVLNADG